MTKLQKYLNEIPKDLKNLILSLVTIDGEKFSKLQDKENKIFKKYLKNEGKKDRYYDRIEKEEYMKMLERSHLHQINIIYDSKEREECIKIKKKIEKNIEKIEKKIEKIENFKEKIEESTMILNKRWGKLYREKDKYIKIENELLKYRKYNTFDYPNNDNQNDFYRDFFYDFDIDWEKICYLDKYE